MITRKLYLPSFLFFSFLFFSFLFFSFVSFFPFLFFFDNHLSQPQSEQFLDYVFLFSTKILFPKLLSTDSTLANRHVLLLLIQLPINPPQSTMTRARVFLHFIQESFSLSNGILSSLDSSFGTGLGGFGLFTGSLSGLSGEGSE